jgi:hypothetical protein
VLSYGLRPVNNSAKSLFQHASLTILNSTVRNCVYLERSWRAWNLRRDVLPFEKITCRSSPAKWFMNGKRNLTLWKALIHVTDDQNMWLGPSKTLPVILCTPYKCHACNANIIRKTWLKILCVVRYIESKSLGWQYIWQAGPSFTNDIDKVKFYERYFWQGSINPIPSGSCQNSTST